MYSSVNDSTMWAFSKLFGYFKIVFARFFEYEIHVDMHGHHVFIRTAQHLSSYTVTYSAKHLECPKHIEI